MFFWIYLCNAPDKADQGREEYIESELARRHAADKAAQEAHTQNPDSSSAAMPTGVQLSQHQGERPTMQGRLQEVDLGDEARARNAAMTEQARRRLAGETIEDESDGSRKRHRVGKDGKPWRGRKRRASDDIKRDQMVEALMRENRRKCLARCGICFYRC